MPRSRCPSFRICPTPRNRRRRPIGLKSVSDSPCSAVVRFPVVALMLRVLSSPSHRSDPSSNSLSTLAYIFEPFWKEQCHDGSSQLMDDAKADSRATAKLRSRSHPAPSQNTQPWAISVHRHAYHQAHSFSSSRSPRKLASLLTEPGTRHPNFGLGLEPPLRASRNR